jgi:hypothetical protein
VLWIRKLFFRIRIHKNFFGIRIWIQIQIRIQIRILQTYILGQSILKFFFNAQRTFSEYNTTKNNFLTVKICVFFSFNCSICHALLLNYSVWIQIRIRIQIFFGFGFGSGKKFRILSDSDPQHC